MRDDQQTNTLGLGTGARLVRSRRPAISIVTPAYNEKDNLPALYERLCRVLDGMKVDWEWIVMDDHSSDATYEVLCRLAAGDARLHVARFSRNFGSHTAIACGLGRARGACAVVLAADLQDPPETIPALIEKWRQGARIVWAARYRREGETYVTRALARLYYAMMRHVIGMKQIPATGADFFLMHRSAVDAFMRFGDRNTSVLGLIAWMGFRQETIHYDKQARRHGTSGWGFFKKIKLAVDSVTAFSYFPIRLMSLAGIVFACCGLGLAALLVVGRLMGYVLAGTGYVAIMTVLLLGFGFLMTFLGILGEYIWRTLDEVRARPRYLIEDSARWQHGYRQQEQQNRQDSPVDAQPIQQELETVIG